MVHPVSTSSPPAIRLWGMSGTLYAFLADSGSLHGSNYRVSVVISVVLIGVMRVWYFSCMLALLHAVLRPMREIDDVVSKKSFFVYIWRVGTARGFFIATNFCGLTNIYDVIFYFFFHFWIAPSFSVGFVSKSHVHPATAYSVVAGCPLLVVGFVPGIGSIGTVVDLSRLVSACEAICVWITLRWPLLFVFGHPGVVSGLIAVLVAAACRWL